MCTCQRELLKDLQREAIRRLAPLDSCTFDSFDTNYYPETAEDNGISPRAKADKIAEACHRYAQRVSLREPANLMLMGQTGLGKTHLSLAIANVAIGRGLSVEYGTAYNILSDLQNENFGRTGNLQYTEERVLHTDLLILDDLGTEYTSAYTVACLYNIINTRILCSRPTVISTNLALTSWRKNTTSASPPASPAPILVWYWWATIFGISNKRKSPRAERNKSKRMIYRTTYKKAPLKGAFFLCSQGGKVCDGLARGGGGGIHPTVHAGAVHIVGQGRHRCRRVKGLYHHQLNLHFLRQNRLHIHSHRLTRLQSGAGLCQTRQIWGQLYKHTVRLYAAHHAGHRLTGGEARCILLPGAQQLL